MVGRDQGHHLQFDISPCSTIEAWSEAIRTRGTCFIHASLSQLLQPPAPARIASEACHTHPWDHGNNLSPLWFFRHEKHILGHQLAQSRSDAHGVAPWHGRGGRQPVCGALFQFLHKRGSSRESIKEIMNLQLGIICGEALDRLSLAAVRTAFNLPARAPAASPEPEQPCQAGRKTGFLSQAFSNRKS